MCNLFQTDILDEVGERVAPCLIPAFQVGVDVDAPYFVAQQSGDIVNDFVPLIVFQVYEMGAQIPSFFVVQEKVQVHDGDTLASGKNLHRDAVVIFKVAMMEMVRHSGASICGIVGVIGRALCPPSGIDRQSQAQFPVVGVCHGAKALVLPVIQGGRDGQRFTFQHGLPQQLRFQGVAGIHRQWHLCLCVEADR